MLFLLLKYLNFNCFFFHDFGFLLLLLLVLLYIVLFFNVEK